MRLGRRFGIRRPKARYGVDPGNVGKAIFPTGFTDLVFCSPIRTRLSSIDAYTHAVILARGG
jgi:hypothetical protein